MAYKVSEIYTKYRIFRDLQLHMLRVAAVANMICDNISVPVRKEEIIKTCLFHDMGNIIKADLVHFPEFLEPEGLDYWSKVKEEFILKYGPNEHVATDAIAKEIGLEEPIIHLVNSVGFSKSTTNEQQKFFENKICNYADMRVSPHGILAVQERILEGRNRNLGTRKSIASDNFELLAQSVSNIEKQIFEKCSILPEDITDEAVAPIILKLKDFVIH